MFSLPLKSGSDSLDVCERELAADFNRGRLLNQFKGAYARAPYFEQTLPLLEQIVRYGDTNLFRYIHHSLMQSCSHLGIATDIRISSDIAIDHELKGQDKVLALCHASGANTYVNAIGGVELYSRDDFKTRGIELTFIKSNPFEYTQFASPFTPWLSIIDVMMFNPLSTIQQQVSSGYGFV